MEKRQTTEDGRVLGQLQPGAELADVGQHIAVAEGDAFRIARGAGGEEQDRFIIAAAAIETQPATENVGGQNLGNDQPRDDLLFEGRQDALNQDEVAVRWPREAGDSADKGVGGDEAIDIGLADAGLDRFMARGEIEVHRGFAGKEHGQVGDESSLARRQNNRHARLVGFLLEVIGKGDCRGEDFVKGKFRVVRAVEDALFTTVFFQSFEQRHRQRAVK